LETPESLSSVPPNPDATRSRPSDRSASIAKHRMPRTFFNSKDDAAADAIEAIMRGR
jgi:hypothetical protein